MSPLSILLPCIALVLLTAVVWVKMYIDRIGEMRAKRIRPQALTSARQSALLLEHVNAADNFRNLFEMPVLFYTLCIALFATQMVTFSMLLGAWMFVALRVAHTAIHLSYNRVNHRFAAYAASSIVLFVLWGMFALSVSQKL